MMLAELWLSTSNERVLLAHGAVEADDPVYGVMRIGVSGRLHRHGARGRDRRASSSGPMTFAGVVVDVRSRRH